MNAAVFFLSSFFFRNANVKQSAKSLTHGNNQRINGGFTGYDFCRRWMRSKNGSNIAERAWTSEFRFAESLDMCIKNDKSHMIYLPTTVSLINHFRLWLFLHRECSLLCVCVSSLAKWFVICLNKTTESLTYNSADGNKNQFRSFDWYL